MYFCTLNIIWWCGIWWCGWGDIGVWVEA